MPSQAVLDAQKRRAELMAAQKAGSAAKIQQISALNKDVKAGTTGVVGTPYAQSGNPMLPAPKPNAPAISPDPGLSLTGPTGLPAVSPDDTPAILRPPQEQPSISEHLQQTYRERANQQEKGSYLEYAETFEAIMGKPAPFKTREEYIDWRKRQNKEDLDFLDQQIDYSRQIEEVQFQKAREQAAGAVSATRAQTAQGREGPISGSAAKFMKEFGGQMGQYLQQLETEKASAQVQREKQRADLQRAQEAGDQELVDTIQGRISSIEDQIREIDRLGAQTELQVGEFELKKAEFQHSAAMDWQANYRANFGMYNEMVMSGAEMSPSQISQFANSLGIPFEVANSFYEGSKNVRANNKLDLEQKNLALQDLAYGFQLRLDGIVGERAEQVNGIMGKVKSGQMTWDEAGEWMMNLGIPSAMNPVTRLDMQMQSADLLAKQIGLKYLDAEKQQSLAMGERDLTLADYDIMIQAAEAANAPAMSVAKLKQARANAELAQLEAYEYGQKFTEFLPDNVAKDIFTLTGSTRIEASSFAGQDGKKQCGEAYNDFTGKSAPVGDSYKSKMDQVVSRTDPHVGNGLVLPLTDRSGKLTTGHIETIIGVNQATGQIQTVSYNRDGNGSQSFQTYDIDDLNAKFGDNWGFTSSKLAPKFEEKLGKVASSASSGVIPQEFSWASTLIENAYGDAEGGKAAARKKELLASAIASGNKQSARGVVMDSILSKVTAGERTSLEDALNVNDEYTKTLNALDEFEKLGASHGLTDVVANEAQRKLLIERDPKAVEVQQRLSQLFNSYRKAITGAGASTKELDMLADSFPTWNKNFADTKIMLKTIQDDAKDRLDRKVSMYSDGVFSGYDDMESQLSSLGSQTGGAAGGATIQTPQWMQFLLGDAAASDGKYSVLEDFEAEGFNDDFF